MRATKFLLILSATACASAPALNSGATQTTSSMVGISGTVAKLSMIAEVDPIVMPLAASPDGAFAQVANAYADVGIPLSVLIPAARMAGNQGWNVRREIGKVGMRNYLMCGQGSGFDNSEVYQISLNVATQIQAQADGTSKVATVLDASATPVGNGSNSVRCSSTGALEARINDAIAKRLNLK